MWEKMFAGVNKIKPYLAMVALQFGYAGMFIMSLATMRRGFSHWILVVYRHVTATVAVVPFAYFLEKKTRPKMTKSIFLKVIALGFLEPVLDQNMYCLGMKYTNATFASATVNILPAVTFIMAVIFRLEKINLKKIPSLAKVIGTAITVTGAMIMTLYKGPIIDILWYLHRGGHATSHVAAAQHQQHWATGTIALLVCILGWAGFFILQNITLKEYPAELSLSALICIAGVIEGGIAAMIMERDIKSWAIGFDSRLLASVYSGLVCSGIAYYMQNVVSNIKGPVFVSAFSPLSTIITAILGAVILAEQAHLGSLIGALIIVVGLYSVVWGKIKEMPIPEKLACDNIEGTAHELPVVNKKTLGLGADINSATAEINIPQEIKYPNQATYHEGKPNS